MKRKDIGKGLTKALMIIILFSLLVPYVAGIIHPINEEAAEAVLRGETSENYEKLIKEQTDSIRNIKNIILENPALYEPGTLRIINYFIVILQPLYVMAIIVIGLYLIFFSGTPKSRSKAKTYLWTLIFGIGLISISPHILMVFFGISKAVTLAILSRAPVNTEEPFIHAADYILQEGVYITSHTDISEYPKGVERAGIPFLFIPYAILQAILLLLKLRVYIVALLSIALPFTITLYSFVPTRGIGKLLVENTILWTISQIAMAGVLIVIGMGVSLTTSITSFTVNGDMKFAMELAGLLMLMVTPIVFVRMFSRFMP